MNPEPNRYLAVDLGASGGTVYEGQITPNGVMVSEVARFDNEPVETEDAYIWDIDSLHSKILDALRKCDAEHGRIDAIGIDTWGIDFGLIADGELLRPPYSYRDPSLTTTRSALIDKIGKREIFEQTGVTNWDGKATLFHYHNIVQNEPEIVQAADQLLMMPQLISLLLGGEPSCEVTVASTTQMIDPRTRSWATDLIEEAGLPTDVLPPVSSSGRVIGNLAPEYANEISGTPELILPASHDTAAAVTGLPLADGERIFLNTGSWFLAGIELDNPEISDEAFEVGASNELGIDDTVRFLRNLNGFFILEECRERWKEDGKSISYDSLIEQMDNCEPFGPLIVPNAPRFHNPGDMPTKIREYCQETGQSPPQNIGETTRCVIESLAVSTAIIIEMLTAVADENSDCIHLGGGGVQNTHFCQMLADAANMPVLAGPAEASAIGNFLSQAFAKGDVPSVDKGRQSIASAFDIATYSPEGDLQWKSTKDRMRSLMHTSDDNI